MSVAFTKEQQKVIDMRGCNILVSAAAGSGKTAVLVERIIKRLTKDVPPLNVDELLVVTYTEAAAAEMKERLRDALEKALEENPGNVHLLKQATLVHNAKITTIHSFCLSVIREHFHEIDLDPGFRIAEEGELKLLKQDVLDNVLENAYEEADEGFLDFTESYASGRDDKKLEELILKVYEFSRSFPSPAQWMSECREQYHAENLAGLEEKEFIKTIVKNTHSYMESLKQVLENAKDICRMELGPKNYEENVHLAWENVDSLCREKTFCGMYEKMKSLNWGRLKPNKGIEVEKELEDTVKDLKKQAKDTVDDIVKQYFYEEPEEMRKDLCHTEKMARVLFELVSRFSEEFQQEKASKNLIDFGDMEHMAMQILTVSKDGKRYPSRTAKEYQKQFKEIMIDEYQDSNFIQETILQSVSGVENGIYNIFMVGDVKQSIYRFRLSRPELFIEKFETYSQTGGEKVRIDLHKNFRSREEVLASVNYFFEKIMDKDLGDVAYDEKAALYPGADFGGDEQGPAKEDRKTEMYLIDTKEENGKGLDAKEWEARVIAAKIKKLLCSHTVLDKTSKRQRPVRFGDIVILVRSPKSCGETFAKTFADEGIPVYTGSREGYFQTQEISVLLDYLKILDNRRQDIPLAGVMLSVIGGFTSEELAKMRAEFPGMKFHEAMIGYPKEGEDECLREKIQSFWAGVEKFRERIPYTAIHELLFQIMDETGYEDYMDAFPDGAKRSANIRMLVEKARAFEKTSYKGVFHFVRYIEKLNKYEVDYGEASVTDEVSDVVRIMSIHKSKGLEFPIVFVAGMSGKFNTQDYKNSICVHPKFGIGMDCVDLERRTKAPTILKRMMQRELKLENAGEELRLLYVAMTRAKEKLILVGSAADAEQKVEKYAVWKGNGKIKMPFHLRASADSYYGFLIPALEGERELPDVKVKIVDPLELYEEKQLEIRETGWKKDNYENLPVEKPFDREMEKNINEQFAFSYPYENEQKRKQKFSVSELKRPEFEDEYSENMYGKKEDETYVPSFMREEKSGGAFRGTAFHKMLELWDFTKEGTKTSIQRQMKQWRESGYMDGDMLNLLDVEKLEKFLYTSLAKRMTDAQKNGSLYREQPFVMGVEPEEIYEGEKDGDLILVQGIIDAWFEEPDGVVLVDYKTDRVSSTEELKRRYEKQLYYYAEALERMTGKRVKENLIYSFALGQLIEVKE